MPYRVRPNKKVVEVNGDVDLKTIFDKVIAKGGPDGWKVSTFITREDIHQIASMIAMGEDDDDAADVSELPYRPIGFRVPSDGYEVYGENNLLRPNPDEDDEEEA